MRVRTRYLIASKETYKSWKDSWMATVRRVALLNKRRVNLHRESCFTFCYLKRSFHHDVIWPILCILFTKIAVVQNEVVLTYHRVRGLYFLAAIFAATMIHNTTWQITCYNGSAKNTVGRIKFRLNLRFVRINYFHFQYSLSRWSTTCVLDSESRSVCCSFYGNVPKIDNCSFCTTWSTAYCMT